MFSTDERFGERAARQTVEHSLCRDILGHNEQHVALHFIKHVVTKALKIAVVSVAFKTVRNVSEVTALSLRILIGQQTGLQPNLWSVRWVLEILSLGGMEELAIGVHLNPRPRLLTEHQNWEFRRQ
ncbi:hypothetical protein TNCV_254681 [Trichonephila clavipes]|nr:hypothetical protein TNCV_254681 [Trichonephila clavipes]